jgi:hypothetical protein
MLRVHVLLVDLVSTIIIHLVILAQNVLSREMYTLDHYFEFPSQFITHAALVRSQCVQFNRKLVRTTQLCRSKNCDMRHEILL